MHKFFSFFCICIKYLVIIIFLFFNSLYFCFFYFIHLSINLFIRLFVYYLLLYLFNKEKFSRDIFKDLSLKGTITQQSGSPNRTAPSLSIMLKMEIYSH